MKPEIRYGLICGLGGLLVNLLLSTYLAFCTPLVSLLAGALAGYLAARQADLPLQRMGARTGAWAGGLAGIITFLGQLLAGLLAWLIYQPIGDDNPFLYTPTSNDPLLLRALFFSSGLGLVACFGLLGAVLAALAGAGLGYFTTQGMQVDN